MENLRPDLAALSDPTLSRTDQHDASVRSDAVTWIEETESGGGHVFRDSATDPVHPGLLAVLRRLRAQAYELDASGFCGFSDAHHGPSSRRPEGVDLGVQRAGQLACYRAPSGARGNSSGASSTGSDDNDGDGNGSSGSTPSLQGARKAHDVADVDEVVEATRGARYTAHRDGIGFGSGSPFRAMLMPSVCMRECTCILYLTEPTDWGEGGESPRVLSSAAEARGGSLVLYVGADEADTSGATATSVVEILPIGGRLVLFDSRSILHEVMPHEHAGCGAARNDGLDRRRPHGARVCAALPSVVASEWFGLRFGWGHLDGFAVLILVFLKAQTHSYFSIAQHRSYTP